MNVAPGLPIENPPKAVAKKKPRTEDYNAVFRDFLGTQDVDLSKDQIDPRLNECFRNETSNSLYGRLKLKEKAYNGSVLVSPIAIAHQQIVVVAVRIIYGGFLRKTMHSEYLHIVFDSHGKFIEVRKGPSTDQDLG